MTKIKDKELEINTEKIEQLINGCTKKEFITACVYDMGHSARQAKSWWKNRDKK